MRGGQSNNIVGHQPVRNEIGYLYGFKARAQRHHCLGYATFTVDVDRLASLRKEYSRRVRPVTYLPLFVKAIALAVQRNPEANAILFKRFWGFKIVSFERVDVNVPITRELNGEMVTFIGTVRDAPSKSLSKIQEELSWYQTGDAAQIPAIRRYRRLFRMPFVISQLVHWLMTHSPRFYVENVGTCGLTLGDGGWYDSFFPIAPTTAVVAIGAARSEPVVRQGRVEVARRLHCSMMVDNFVLSGLAASRLGEDLHGLLASGSFISEELTDKATAREGNDSGS